MTKDTKHTKEPTTKTLSDDELETIQGGKHRGGNVETTWKVEEGDASPPPSKSRGLKI